MPELDSGLLVAFDVVAFDTERLDRVTVFSLVFFFSRSESRFAFVIFIFLYVRLGLQIGFDGFVEEGRLEVKHIFTIHSCQQERTPWCGG